MQKLLDKIDHIDMLISSEYDLDEMVRVFIPSPAGEEKVRRIYWVYYGLDHEGPTNVVGCFYVKIILLLNYFYNDSFFHIYIVEKLITLF